MDAMDIVAVIAILVFLGLYVYSIFWATADAEARGKSGCLVALLVTFLSWLLGLLLWVIFRPERQSG